MVSGDPTWAAKEESGTERVHARALVEDHHADGVARRRVGRGRAIVELRPRDGGGNQQDRIRHDRQHLREHGPEHGSIPLQQFEAGLTGFLADASRKDDDAGPCEIAVLPGIHHGRRHEGDRMGDILGLRDGECLISVDKNDLARKPHQRQRISGRTANHSCTNNANFHGEFLRKHN